MGIFSTASVGREFFLRLQRLVVVAGVRFYFASFPSMSSVGFTLC